MKKLRPFTLIERREVAQAFPKGSASKTRVGRGVTRGFERALHSTFGPEAERALEKTARSRGAKSGAKASVASQVSIVLQDLSRGQKVLRVGVLDMGAWIGHLPSLIESINGVQSLFTLFEVQAAMPAGLRRTPDGLAKWLEYKSGESVSKSERNSIAGDHVLADEFLVAADATRKSLSLDYLVGVTPAFVAGVDHEFYWNHFSAHEGRCILVSVADVRKFASEAGRPFEVGVGVLIVAALLVATNPVLEFHDDTGCVFDYNESRVSLVETIRELRIDDQCRKLLKRRELAALLAVIQVLKKQKVRG